MPTIEEDVAAFALALRDTDTVDQLRNISGQRRLNWTYPWFNSTRQFLPELRLTPTVRGANTDGDRMPYDASMSDIPSLHAHALIINIIGFALEGSAVLSNIGLLTYAARRLCRSSADVTFGVGLHLALVGLVMAIFMVGMHTLLLTRSSDYVICVYYLYLRDTLASLYLYLLVVHLIVYSRVSYPPRLPTTSRWKAKISLIHSLPWVLSIGAALPICVMNLGSSMVFPSAYDVSDSFIPLPRVKPVRGLCVLNIKFDVISLFLEVVLFIVPVVMCLGIGISVLLKGGPLGSYNNRERIVSFSRNIVLLTVGLVVITQAPFAFSRLVSGTLRIVQSNSLMSHTLARYFTQMHIVLFAVNPVVLLATLMLLQGCFVKTERHVDKNHVLPEMDDEDPSQLRTNCMLTSV